MHGEPASSCAKTSATTDEPTGKVDAGDPSKGAASALDMPPSSTNISQATPGDRQPTHSEDALHLSGHEARAFPGIFTRGT